MCAKFPTAKRSATGAAGSTGSGVGAVFTGVDQLPPALVPALLPARLGRGHY